MRYEDVADLLPALVDGPEGIDREILAFVELDLRCQAELARYRRLRRSLEELRTRHAEPAPGLLAETLAGLSEASAPRRVRSMLPARRIALVGAIGGVVAGAAATVVVLARRRMSPAGGVG